MALARRAIRNALLDRLKTKTDGIRYWSAAPEMIEDVKVKPAAVLVTEEHRPQLEVGLPTLWTLAYTLRIYAQRPASRDVSPDDQLDDFLDQVADALVRDPVRDPYPALGPTESQTTLGGVCQRAWISGQAAYGTVEGDSFLDIPISIDAVEGA